MHIPDGFLSAPVAVATGVVAIAAIAVAVKETNKKMGEKQVPMMGVLAAFIFAAQMLNFPVAGGTSGHFRRGGACRDIAGAVGHRAHTEQCARCTIVDFPGWWAAGIGSQYYQYGTHCRIQQLLYI